METKKDKIMMVAPDGGWGWLIVLGSSLINFSTRAIEPSFGLLFGGFLRQLGVETAGASLVISTLGAIIYLTGIIVGPLIKKYHYRKVAMIGGVITSSAIMLTALANSMLHILLTFGVLGGIGFGLTTSCTYVCINDYFSKKKAQAVGLAMAGTAVGFMIMPQIVRILLDEYDFRSALVILGAVSLHTVVGACLFQPVAWHQKAVIVETDEEEDNTLLSSDKMEDKDQLISIEMTNELRNNTSSPTLGNKRKLSKIPSQAVLRKTSIISYLSITDFTGSALYLQSVSEKRSNRELKKATDEKKFAVQNKSKKKSVKSYLTRFYKFMDLDLLKDGVYLNILYGISMCIVTEMNFTLIVPFFLSNIGYTHSEIAAALSSMAISDLSARVVVPPIIDRVKFSRRLTFLSTTICVAFLRSGLALLSNFGPIIAALVIIGFFRGISQIAIPLVLAEYSSGNNFASVYGLAMVSGGAFIVVLGPLTGYIRDVTSSYPFFIHSQTVLMISVLIAWLVEMLIIRPKNKKPVIDDEFQGET